MGTDDLYPLNILNPVPTAPHHNPQRTRPSSKITMKSLLGMERCRHIMSDWTGATKVTMWRLLGAVPLCSLLTYSQFSCVQRPNSFNLQCESPPVQFLCDSFAVIHALIAVLFEKLSLSLHDSQSTTLPPKHFVLHEVILVKWPRGTRSLNLRLVLGCDSCIDCCAFCEITLSPITEALFC